MVRHQEVMKTAHDAITAVMGPMMGSEVIDQLTQGMSSTERQLKPMFVTLANLVALTGLYSPLPESKDPKSVRQEKLVKCASGLLKSKMRPSPILCRDIENQLVQGDLKTRFHQEMTS